MVIKVKEPLPTEFGYFREGLVLYTYLHLAAFPELTRELHLQEGLGRRLRDDHRRQRRAAACCGP